MSTCELVYFKDGKAACVHEWSNSWGGAARIWTSLYDKHLKDPLKPYDSWLGNGGKNKPLWDLAKRTDLPNHHRAVHAFTFDFAMVSREHFQRLADDLRKFADDFQVDGVCHLRSWADAIESCEFEAVGLHATSVSESLWFDWDEEADESIPYDLNAREDHFEVYEELDKVDLTEGV